MCERFASAVPPSNFDVDKFKGQSLSFDSSQAGHHQCRCMANSAMSLQKIGSTLWSPFVKLGTAYSNAAAKRPFVVGVLTTGVKTSAADLFAQTVRTSLPEQMRS